MDVGSELLHILGTDHFSTKDKAGKGQTGRAEAVPRTASKQAVCPHMGEKHRVEIKTTTCNLNLTILQPRDL